MFSSGGCHWLRLLGQEPSPQFWELGALAAICDPKRAAAEELADRYHALVAEFTVGC